MKFKYSPTIDQDLDLILPIKKSKQVGDQIKKLTRVSQPVFDGEHGEIKIMYGESGQRIFVLGLGGESELHKCCDAFRKLAYETKKHWSKQIQIDCSQLNGNEVVQMTTGLLMAEYNLGVFKTDSEAQISVDIILCSEVDISASGMEGKAIGETMNRIKALVDAPANQKTPDFLARWAEDSAKRHGFLCTVKREKELKEEGFDAIIAVGKGSIHPPRLIELSYLPLRDKPVELVLAGKGITFDSGGLSIKGSTNLHYMKSDMGGAAVVLGTIELAAKLGLNINLVGIVAAAENSVDANSFRPSDVIDSYSGKTIEIIDTDAEGRLVLADAVNYAVKTHKPGQIIDLATLTGSVVRTLGYSAAGMFTKNKSMAEKLEIIGNEINEKVWPLPLFKEFEKDLHSDIADIRNFSGKPIAGAINAAKFIEAFTEDHPNWLHLDIAGVAFGNSSYAKMKSATGYGLRLMIEYIKSIEN